MFSKLNANAREFILSVPRAEEKNLFFQSEIKNAHKNIIEREKEISKEDFMCMSKEEKKFFLQDKQGDPARGPAESDGNKKQEPSVNLKPFGKLFRKRREKRREKRRGI